MERDVECWVGLACGREHQIDGRIELSKINPEMSQPVVQTYFQHAVRSNPHGLGAQKRKGVCGGLGCHDQWPGLRQYFSSGRPTELFGSFGLGSSEKYPAAFLAAISTLASAGIM